jgi:predicted transcriptional regulator
MFAVLIISSCSIIPTSPRPVEVVTVAESIPMYNPPLPLEVQLNDVSWEVLTPLLMQEYLAELEKGSAPQSAYYSLTSKEYEKLSMNLAEIKRYLRDTLSIVEYYREYDKEEEKSQDDK